MITPWASTRAGEKQKLCSLGLYGGYVNKMRDTHIDAMPEKIRSLYSKAAAAMANAYIPYSGFAVGAAVLCADGSVFTGCNIENASYGLCCCAERNAIFSAVCSGKREFDCLLAVAATPEPVSPCGACRQVMSEFKIGQVVLANLDGKAKACNLDELLPYRFSL